MKIIKATIYVDEELLKEIYSDLEEFNFNDAFESEMDWICQSGMRLGEWTVEKEEE